VSTTACARCDKQVPTEQLIPHQGRRICLECEMDIDDTKRLRNSVYRSIASLPAAVILGWLTLCVPYLNLLLFPLASIGVCVLSVQGIRLGLSIQQDPEEYGVGSAEPIILIVLGAMSGLAGLAMVGFSLILVAGVVMSGML